MNLSSLRTAAIFHVTSYDAHSESFSYNVKDVNDSFSCQDIPLPDFMEAIYWANQSDKVVISIDNIVFVYDHCDFARDIFKYDIRSIINS